MCPFGDTNMATSLNSVFVHSRNTDLDSCGISSADIHLSVNKHK